VSGLPQNWDSRYVMYSGALKSEKMSDPHAVNSWIQHLGRKALIAKSVASASPGISKNLKKKKIASKVDWNVSLGSNTANLGPFVYAAKYSFDINALPSCSDDFVAYGLATPGSATQATMIGFSNLYASGQVNGGGMCDSA